MKNLPLIIIALVLIALIALTSIFTVDERERALVFRFNEIVNVDVEPGLHLKLPFLDSVRKFEKRYQILEAPPTAYLTLDKEYLDIDAYIIWRIGDVYQYYKSTSGSQARAKSLIEQRAIDVLKNKVSQRSMTEVISGKREELMSELTNEVASSTESELGIEIKDIRLMKVDFPDETRNSVFDRMRRDRNKEAELYRAEGIKEATKIQAQADKEREVLLAGAYRQAEELRGQGDGEAAAIYAQTYQQDSEFYEFYRSVTAYEEAFSDKSDVLLVSPENDFFRYMQESRPN